MNEAEKKIFLAIQAGVFDVRSDGTIWRNFYENTYKNKHVNKELPARAEYYSNGYLELRTKVNGVAYRTKAHRIVWMFFNGEIPDDMEINHKDGIRSHNHPLNLEVVTNQENMIHAYTTGLAHGRPGMSHHLVKITDDDVREIRRLYATGLYSQSKLGGMYDLSQGQVGRIIRKERWQTVE